MQNEIKLQVLNSIEKVYERSKGSRLKDSLFHELDADLNILSDYFGVSQKSAVLLSLIFTLNYCGSSVALRELVKVLDCNPVRLLNLSDELISLNERGILVKETSLHRVKVTFNNDQYYINEQVTRAILSNNPMPVLKPKEFNNAVDCLEKIFNLSLRREPRELLPYDLVRDAELLVAQNQQFPLIKAIYNFNLNSYDLYLFCTLIWKALTGSRATELSEALDCMFQSQAKNIEYMQQILSGNNSLITNHHIEVLDSSFFNDAKLTLTNKTYALLQECGINLFSNIKALDNVISAEEIKAKILIFNADITGRINLLKSLLQADKLRETQERLMFKNLPKGINVLLYGGPGTGKTESVYQIARETGRDIYKVDMSETKSKWFGESEKKIKKIFTDYKHFAGRCEKTPILLFNEADAIISKRLTRIESSSEQALNSIQNIILEELENFDGILFATTNLISNLDSAFERRFLFKIDFQIPDFQIKAQIWKQKLPVLSEDECDAIARRFDFSGGQIDNVYRMSEIHEILNGEFPGFQQILEFCKKETFQTNRTKTIGYSKN